MLYIYLIRLKLKLIDLKKKKTPEKFECMEYICDEIILVIEYEKLHIYFETRVVGGLFC